MKRRIPCHDRVSASAASALALTGCGQAGQGDGGSGDGRPELTMWTHSAGNPAELAVYEQIIDDFNASQDEYKVVRRVLPAGRLQRRDRRGAASGDLPCLLDLDGPIVPNWAWAEYLQPLGLPTSSPTTCSRRRSATYERRDLLGRVLGCRAVDLRPQVGARRQRHPHPDDRRAVDDGRVRRGARHAEGCRLRHADRHRRRGHRRVVAVRLLAHAAELRRRPHRPRHDAHGRRRAQRPRGGRVGRRGSRTPVRRRLRQQQRARSATRSSSTTRSRSATRASGTRWTPLDAVGDDLLILPAAGLRQRPQDRRRVVAVGHLVELRRGRRCARVPGVQLPGQVHRRVRDKQVVIPATDGCRGALASTSVRTARCARSSSSRRRIALARPATPAYAVISSTFEKAAKDIMNGADVQSTLDGAVHGDRRQHRVERRLRLLSRPDRRGRRCCCPRPIGHLAMTSP